MTLFCNYLSNDPRITESHVIPEIDMTAIQTGSKSCLSVHDSCERNFNCYTHLSEVKQFSGVVDDFVHT